MSRALRLGQTDQVVIKRYVMENTVEVFIDQVVSAQVQLTLA